jgi:hypothetical protein
MFGYKFRGAYISENIPPMGEGGYQPLPFYGENMKKKRKGLEM